MAVDLLELRVAIASVLQQRQRIMISSVRLAVAVLVVATAVAGTQEGEVRPSSIPRAVSSDTTSPHISH